MYKYFFKRLIDFLLALIILICISPILLFVTVWLFFANKGAGAFFFQERPGKDEKIFKVIKFKSMTDERDADGNLLDDDLRITKAGKFVRSTSIDELPQILNLLNGTMSLIGPRPDPPDWLDKYPEDIKVFLTVKPGLTGYSQAYYRNSADGEEKMKNDAYYAKHISFIMDVKIFFKTIAIVLGHDNTYKDTSNEEEAMKQVEELRKK